jgi:filamentous hemagglutinin family protein
MKNNKTASLSLRKLLLSVLVTAPLATLPVPLQALPSSASNLASQYTATSSGTTVTWTSATQVDVASTAANSFIKWVDFGAAGMTIGQGDTINYALPSSSSSILNMVTGTNRSTIDGMLQSNGNIYVMNPNGITVDTHGVISANGVGLSTVPETEYNFLSTGTLQFIENQGVPTSNTVVVNPGATITAASGTGNVWIAAKGADLAGTIDAGAVSVKSVQSGNVRLGQGGDLTIGDVVNHNATLAVTTDGGSISSSSNVTVLGPTVTLTAANATISQTGALVIGGGAGGNATLTTNSGTGSQSFADAHVNGTGLLTVNATGTGTIGITSSAGKLAVGASGGSVASGALTVQSNGDLTLNAGNVTSVSATSDAGNILSGGTLITNGTVGLTVSSGKDVALHTDKATGGVTLTLSSGTSYGNVSLVQDAGNLAVPTLSAANITASAGNITLNGDQTATKTASYSATGNVTLGKSISAVNVSVSAGKDITLDATGDINNTRQPATAGNVTLAATGNVTTNGIIGAVTGVAPAKLTITGGNVTIGNSVGAGNISVTATNDLASNGELWGAAGVTNGSFSLTATNGNVSITKEIGVTNTSPKTLTVNAGGNVTVGANVLTQTGGTVSITAGSSNLTQSGTIATDTTGTTGNVTLTSTSGSVSVGNTIRTGKLSVTAGNVATIGGAVTAANVVASATNDLTQSSAITATGGNVTLTSTAANVTIGNTIDAGNATVSAGAKVIYNAKITAATSTSLTATGNIELGADLVAPALTLSSGKDIVQTGGSITSTGNASITSAGVATLGTATNDFNNVKLLNTGAASITDTNGITLADGTNAAGNVTVTAGGAVNLGNTANGTLTFGKALTITATGASIDDKSNNITVLGNVSLTTTGAGVVTLDGSAGNGVGLNSSYGQVSVTTAGQNASVFENTTLNLGVIDLGTGVLTAFSNTGIINTGKLTTGDIWVGAGTVAAPGDVTLDNSTNAIGGTIRPLSDLRLLGSNSNGYYLVNNLKVVNTATNAALVEILPNVYGNPAAINLDLTTSGATQLSVGQLSTTGTVKLTAGTGGISAVNANNTINNVRVKSGGAVAVKSAGALTVNSDGVSAGTATYTVLGNGTLTIGSYKSDTTGATTFDASAMGAAIVDSVPNIAIYGPVTFKGGSVSVTQAGHSFGGVTIDTSAANGSATIVESGYLNLLSVQTGSGAFTATSSNGGIIQGTGSTGIITSGNATFTAPTGVVTLSDAANNKFDGSVALTAVGNSAINNTVDTKLGTIVVGSGTLDVVASSGKNITQATGSSVYAYGATKFATGGGGKITVTNSGNQFGGLTLTTGTGNISVTEQTTMNLKSVTTSGTFTATSAGGSIVDSGALAATGTSILSAQNGDILLTKSSDFGTVSFTTNGSVTVKDANAIALGNSTIGGNLTVTATSLTQPGALSLTGNGNITTTGAVALNTSNVGGTFTVNAGGAVTQSGALNVAGNTSFTATTLTLNNTANTFGAFRFNTTGTTLIDEATTFNLLAGSVSTGAVTINTGGDFITSGTGGSSFTGSGLTINASGTIIPTTGSLLVTGTFTVNSPSTKDLSALSKAGNLANHDPVDQGTGAYTGPQP